MCPKAKGLTILDILDSIANVSATDQPIRTITYYVM